MTTSILKAAGLSLLASLLVACGGDKSTAPPASGASSSSLSGTAAVGAPLANATIQVRCSGGFTGSTVANATGRYTITVPLAALPCALRATPAGGGQALHSLSVGSSATLTANITPLTDLALARQVQSVAGQAVATWFDGLGSSPAISAAISGGMVTALDSLRSALLTAGFPLPANWPAGSTAPLTQSFTPDPATDPFDQLLEAIATAIADSTVHADYAALLAAFGAGGSLPPAPEDDVEAPTELAVLVAYAGTYTVSGTATGDDGYRGTANRNHARGTITIHPNGDVDFDTGISFTAAQVVAVYDRRTIAHDKRVAVNYGASDSDERIRLYFNADGTAPANIVEIIHDNGSGTTTRAAIGSGGGGSDPEESEFLGSDSGTSALFGGTRITRTDVTSFTGPPLSVGAAYLETGTLGGSFHLDLSGFGATPANIGQAQACNNMAAPGLAVTQDGNYFGGMPNMGGNCVITVTEITATMLRGTFSGTLSNGAGDTLTVQDGEFQYVRTPFAAGGGLPQVAASFEGLTLGYINGQGNGTGDAGWSDSWIGYVPLVAAGTELSVTPAGGSALNGGSNAVRIQDFSGIQAEGRLFSQAFSGDVYVGALMRVNNADASISQSWITLGNGAVYLGLDTSDVSNQFTASLGDAAGTKVRVGGTVAGNQTYLLVARLRKTGGSATYNEIALWVNPAISDSATPLGTATRTQGTGSLYLVDRLGFRGRQFKDLLIDRLRVSDSWAGVFADPAAP